jgi:hypothetical protein
MRFVSDAARWEDRNPGLTDSYAARRHRLPAITHRRASALRVHCDSAVGGERAIARASTHEWRARAGWG